MGIVLPAQAPVKCLIKYQMEMLVPTAQDNSKFV